MAFEQALDFLYITTITFPVGLKDSYHKIGDKMIRLNKVQEAIYDLELTESEASILRAVAGKTTGEGPGFKFICNLHSAIAKAGIEPDKTILFEGHFEKDRK